jgi:hypothetical protein
MAGPYIVRPLDQERIAQAFPLVMVLDPGLTLDRWSRFATAFVRSMDSPEPREIITVQNEQNYIHGLASCRLRRDLHHGRVLEVENFVSLDLTGHRCAARALLEGMEELARDWNCSHICLSLLNPRLRTYLRDAHSRAGDLFDCAGYREEPFRLGKDLSAQTDPPRNSKPPGTDRERAVVRRPA